jgi:anhydro-N-acetylmuramic acid kinase
MNVLKGIGVMSGTSLDGVDVAYCEFAEENNKWKYSILNAETFTYSNSLKSTLANLENSSALDFAHTHKEYGHFLGKLINDFITKNKIVPEFVASHGHTIFHQPEIKFTFQIGDGAAIAAECGLPVICDFRSLDVAKGGQGAPLVPVGDKLLFDEFEFCLNLGGFANISYDKNNVRIAHDICPVNIVLNNLTRTIGKEFDFEGGLASKGRINSELLKDINQLEFYHLNAPKSLGKEWVLKYLMPVLDRYEISLEDKLATLCEHIAYQIAVIVGSASSKKMLVTGGGAYNKFLMSKISELCNCKVIIPDSKTVEYKEALIFAFLGLLRLNKQVNCLKSVTGAESDNVGGAIYLG